MEGGCLFASSSLEWSGLARRCDGSSVYGRKTLRAAVLWMEREGKGRALYGRMNHCAPACFSAASFPSVERLEGNSLYTIRRFKGGVEAASDGGMLCTRKNRKLISVSASLGRATESWMEEYMKDESDSESADEMASLSGEQQHTKEVGKGSREGQIARAVVVAEGLAVTAAGAVFAGQALGLIRPSSQKPQRLAMVSPGKHLPPPPPSAPFAPWWQLFPLWLALAINFLSRAVHIFVSPTGARSGGSAALGWAPPSERSEAARLMEERVVRIEEDVGTTIKMVRKLSRQMEKLGIRFRVTRRTLKAPIEETAELAQNTSLATEDLSARATRLERELQELQQLLLAMQTQSGRQLELVATLTQAVKTTRHGPVLKLPRHHRAVKPDARRAQGKEDSPQSPKDSSSGGGERGVLQKLGDFGRGVFGMSDDEGGGAKTEGRPPSSGGRRGEERPTTGDAWAGLARKGAAARNANGKAGANLTGPLAGSDKDTEGVRSSQSFRGVGGSEQTHSLRPKGNGHHSHGSTESPLAAANGTPPSVIPPPPTDHKGAHSRIHPQDRSQGPAPMGAELRPGVGLQGTRKSVDFWADPEKEGSAVRGEGLQEGTRSPDSVAVPGGDGEKGREGVAGKGEEGGARGEGGGEASDQAGSTGPLGGDLLVPDAGGKVGGESGKGPPGVSEGKVVEENGEGRELSKGVVDGLEGVDVTMGGANSEGHRHGKATGQDGDGAK